MSLLISLFCHYQTFGGCDVELAVLWLLEPVLSSLAVDLVLKKSKKFRKTLQIPLVLCCGAHSIHALSRRLSHVIDWFMCLMDNIIGAFTDCIGDSFNLFERQFVLLMVYRLKVEFIINLVRILTSEFILEMTHSSPWRPMFAFELILVVIISSM